MSLVTRERRGSVKETERQLVVVLVGDKAKDDGWIWEFSGSLFVNKRFDRLPWLSQV